MRRLLLILAGAITTYFALALGTIAHADANPRLLPPAVGKVVSVIGQAEIRRVSSAQWIPAEAGLLLNAGDVVRTGDSGRISLLLADETLMQLHHSSLLQLKQVAQNAGWFRFASFADALSSAARSIYQLAKGRLWARNNNRRVDIDFETAVVTAGVRGTELTLEVREDRSVRSVVLEGAVEHRNDAGSVVANSGEQVVTRPGQAPAKTVLVRPRDAVQWTITIPGLVTLESLLGAANSNAGGPMRLAARDTVAVFTDQYLAQSADSELRGAVIAILAEARRERYARALRLTEQALRNWPNDLSLQILRPALHLHLGDVRLADRQLRDLAGRYPRRAEIWAYLAITRLMLDETREALEASARAAALRADVADYHIVHAYTLQSDFQLSRAIAAARQAVAADPNHELARVTLARLLFGNDQTDAAAGQINAALSIEPDSAAANNLAGFIALARRDLNAASNAFDRAIEGQPALADPHMGLGIVAMRRGDIARALEEISTAVVLEPQRSLLLSYWGKMLYQAKRFDKALQVLARAETLDPNDPTPVFYRALILRDLNRDAEAIAALHEAVELNDNRAVYRSRFLLDRDLAVRNVDLSRLYDRLGLRHWALRKAYAAVKSDYANANAHLFLAGALGAEGDRTYSLSSELLVSLLFKPANVNTFNTFNDYTTLFEVPATGGRVRALAGTDDTADVAVTVYGASPRANLAYTAGAEHFETGGWRETNAESRDDAFVNLKWEPSASDSFFTFAQLFRSSADDKPFPRFEFDDPASPDDRTDNDAALLELGYHRRISHRDALIAYASMTRFESDSLINVMEQQGVFDITGTLDTTAERPSSQVQTQYLRRSKAHQWHAGVLLYDGMTKVRSVDTLEQRVGPVIIDSATFITDNEVDLRYASVYVQDNWQVTPATAIEAALYLDRMENADPFTDRQWTVEEAAPRIGVIWSPAKQHTVRAAIFKYVLPFAASRADPTDVAGIPIFRNTTEGSVITEADLVYEFEWQHGLLALTAFGLDEKFEFGEDTLEGQLRGIEGRIDWLAGRSYGASGGLRAMQVESARDPTLERDETQFDFRLTAQYPGGLGAALSHTVRELDFDNGRDREVAEVTDVEVSYEFPDKAGDIRLEVRNLLDNDFNWVVDQFVFEGRNPVRETRLSLNLFF